MKDPVSEDGAYKDNGVDTQPPHRIVPTPSCVHMRTLTWCQPLVSTWECTCTCMCVHMNTHRYSHKPELFIQLQFGSHALLFSLFASSQNPLCVFPRVLKPFSEILQGSRLTSLPRRPPQQQLWRSCASHSVLGLS